MSHTKPHLNDIVVAIALSTFISACATTPQSAGSGSIGQSVTKTGADGHLDSLSREDLARQIPAPTPVNGASTGAGTQVLIWVKC